MILFMVVNKMILSSIGGVGNDVLLGNLGNDIINGNDGNDFIHGGQGNDLLSGDLGDDILFGGQGNDTFVLAQGDGTDTIEDFLDGNDLIGLSGGISFPGDLSFDGENIILASTSEVLAKLTGIDTTTLTAEDFTTII